ncbi:MAG TPA: hypothetical protein VJY41_06730 [Prolixibacteraceae bacterium]|nr:hypothetical protein [Prolixibacteraceae bacterium]
MQHYIDQLIGDIREATLNVKPPHKLWFESYADPDDEGELEDMSYVEQYLYGKEEPISDITGIDVSLLPPPNKLTEDQQAIMSVELEKLLEIFHFHLDFPETYPAHLRYPFIVNFWNESHVPLSFGKSHIEFCDYCNDYCAFPDYCTVCPEVKAQMEFDEQFETDDTKMEEIDINDLLVTPKNIENWLKMQENEKDDIDQLFRISKKNDDEFGFVGGFFHDDGTPIDPNSIPVPGLCIICKKHNIDDPEENILCMLNRSDQRNESNFQCGAFESIKG